MSFDEEEDVDADFKMGGAEAEELDPPEMDFGLDDEDPERDS